MQAKGLVKFLALALLLVCLFQLSFTFLAGRVEKKAENYAAGKYSPETQADEYSNAKFKYLDSVSTENVFLGYTYNDVKQRKLNLGLDLQGGMSAVLQVSLDEMIANMAVNKEDEVLKKALAEAKKMQKDSQEDLVALFGKAFEQQNPGAKLAALFQRPEYRDQIQFQSSNQEVLDFIRTESKEAVQSVFKILRSRIDRFGVAQPNINLIESSNRIVVELPGIDDPERVRKLLVAMAKLEFWETYETGPEYFELIQKINDAVAEAEGVKKEEPKVEAAAASPDGEAADSTLVADSAETSELDSLAEESGDDESLVSKAGGTDTPADSLAEIRAENPFFTTFQPNQYSNSAIVGFVTDIAQFRKYMELPAVRRLMPSEVKFLLSAKPRADEEGNPTQVFEVYGVKSRSKDKRPALEGDVIVDARSDLDPNTQRRVVNMRMNSTGAKSWKKITASNIDKSVAIVLDDRVYSAPVVRSEIAGGNSEISGNFTTAEADDLANILKAGKMPATAYIVEEAVVGPSLGEKSISDGLKSLVAGLVMVLLFMVFYYNKGGWVADLALVLNLFFVIGVLASLGATLTLPGMAGIVLTIGMAVDANVIIFERIREELAAGSSLRKAIADGYSKSYSAIIDANLTTLITAAILFYFGLGPVLGFATVLMIGIFSSLFTAILVTRLVIDWYVGKGNEMSFSTKMTEGILQNTHFDFLGKRKITYAISATLLCLGLLSIAVRGFDWGVDFEGGNTYVVEFAQPVGTTEISTALKGHLDGAPDVISYGEGGRSVKIKTNFLVGSEDADAGERVERKLYEGLQPYIGGASFDDFKQDFVKSSQKVGPTIADDITRGAYFATIFALLGIFLYILVRFRRWQFGLAAVLATAHDALILLGLYSIFAGILPFSLEIDQVFIAALLTVIGYSINDTVVVFDRIRENLNLGGKHGDEKTLINQAINSTLSRTLMTSLTTLLVVLILFIFGGVAIRDFSFALLVGITVGTYSSIFVATPLMVDLSDFYSKRKEQQAANAPSKGSNKRKASANS